MMSPYTSCGICQAKDFTVNVFLVILSSFPKDLPLASIRDKEAALMNFVSGSLQLFLSSFLIFIFGFINSSTEKNVFG